MPLFFWLDIVALSLSIVIATALILSLLGTGPDRVLNRLFALFALTEACWALMSPKGYTREHCFSPLVDIITI